MAAPSADVTMNMWTRSCNHSQVSSSNTNTDLFQKYLVHNTRDKDFYQFLTEAKQPRGFGFVFFFFPLRYTLAEGFLLSIRVTLIRDATLPNLQPAKTADDPVKKD